MRGLLPFLAWFPCPAARLRADAVAGMTVWLLLVPQAMAYARLAGLPPVHGLWASVLPMLVGALFGRCAVLNTGPVAMTALLTAAALAPFAASAPAGSAAHLGLAASLAALVGLVRLGLGLVRFSLVVNFFSHPVVVGFTTAAGIVIGLSQVGELFGLPGAGGGNLLLAVARSLGRLSEAHWPSVAMAAGTLAAILALARWAPRLPGVLLAVAAATAASWASGYAASGGRVVGAIPAGVPPLALPPLEPHLLLDLLPAAVWIAMIGFLEVFTVSKLASARTREPLDLDRELIAQGLAGLAGAASGGMPVSGSLSRSALNLASGATTGLSSVICAGLMLLTLLVATPLLHHLPLASLAAVLVLTISRLLRIRPLIRAWRIHPHDGLAGTATLVVSVVLAPQVVDGMVAGMVLAVGLFLWRSMRPRVVRLGRHPDGTLRDAVRHGLAEREDAIVLRFDGRLFFANVAWFEQAVLDALARSPSARWVVLCGEGINELDASGAESLRRVAGRLGEAGIGFAIAGLKAQITDALERAGLMPLLGSRLHRTADAALAAIDGAAPTARAG